ncbi:16S rRNA (cytidine(1402)-2'-O)-methyltransferase [Sediminivirga luteola]|uniref:Ribosomal RNA small subunit methyltransferase I n=1 Tax=Sediminivirga luteola TaxID=1774748 RepID=A0A8J2TY00_9MICO|nr:16S rRNA (cytidine(1402)-2'-O)-methyltransferase [Sediminivirga luteola]GGA14790.1 ribosomal RNA small subunit methyltransferase I [Sediminivirga luteola]
MPSGAREEGAAASGEGGRLILLGTPIGNIADASPRLTATLASLDEDDLIAAEDTRVLRKLATALGVELRARLLSAHEHNEASRAGEILQRLREGRTVALVTDAGMPAISDPGFRIVQHCAEAGVPVIAVPGPSAVPTALALSGLPSDRFCFEGFPPRKPGELRAALDALAREPRTLVFFESPHRIAATLAAMAQAFGSGRRASVSRELTKTWEETRRGTLADLAAHAQTEGFRGELTVVVAGASEETPEAGAREAEHASEVLRLAGMGLRLKDAAGYLAEREGLSRRELYQAALRAREGSPD